MFGFPDAAPGLARLVRAKDPEGRLSKRASVLVILGLSAFAWLLVALVAMGLRALL